jgi:biotin carboxyl carrier protein
MKLRVTVDAQTYEVEVGDIHARPVVVMVDGEAFEVWPEETAVLPDAPVPPMPRTTAPASAKPAAAAPSAETANTVLAPIPGVILSIAVKEGDTVQYGQELCVLEAMKMKNVIRANRVGTVSAIRVGLGDQVRHGQVILEYAG